MAANRAVLTRPVTHLEVEYRPTAGRLWVSASVIERPVGTVVKFGALFITALTETAALAASDAILEEAYPEHDGYVRTFDVVPVLQDVLEHGLNWYTRERAQSRG